MNMQSAGVFVDFLPDMKTKITQLIEYEIDEEHLIEEQNRMASWCTFGMKMDEVLNNYWQNLNVDLTQK